MKLFRKIGIGTKKVVEEPYLQRLPATWYGGVHSRDEPSAVRSCGVAGASCSVPRCAFSEMRGHSGQAEGGARALTAAWPRPTSRA